MPKLINRRYFLEKLSKFITLSFSSAQLGKTLAQVQYSNEDVNIDKIIESRIGFYIRVYNAEIDWVNNHIKDQKEYIAQQNEFKERYIKKYGTVEKPKIAIKEDFNFKEVSGQFNLVSVKMDNSYFEILSQLYEICKILNADLEHLSYISKLDTKILFPDLESLISDLSLKQRKYVLRENSNSGIFGYKLKEYSIDSPFQFIKFIETIAEMDFGFEEFPHFAIDEIRHLSILNEISKYPDMMAVVSDPKILRDNLEGILEKILDIDTGLLPELVVYKEDIEYFQLKKLKGAAANYTGTTDTIHTFGKELYRHMITLPHEYGHALVRSSILNNIDENIRFAENEIKRCEEYSGNIKKIIERLKNLRDDRINIYKLDGDINKILLDAHKAKEALDSQNYKRDLVYTQLGEAGAYLFQDIVSNEYAKINYDLGVLLIELSEFQAHYTPDEVHFGAYKFAKELKEKFGGDSVKAFEKIASINAEREIAEAREKINGYNKMINSGFADFNNTEFFEYVQLIKNKRSEILKKVLFIEGEIEKVLQGDDKTISAKIDSIAANQKRLVESYQKYINYIFNLK